MAYLHIPGLESQEHAHNEEDPLVYEEGTQPDDTVFGTAQSHYTREVLGLGEGEEKERRKGGIKGGRGKG